MAAAATDSLWAEDVMSMHTQGWRQLIQLHGEGAAGGETILRWDFDCLTSHTRGQLFALL